MQELLSQHKKKQLIDLLDDWFENIYQQIYHEKRLLDKCRNLETARGQWEFCSTTHSNTYIFKNVYLGKCAQIVDECVIGFFSQKDFAFFLHINAEGKTQVEIGDLEYFQKEGCLSDWHISDIVVIPDFLDEVCEGSFDSDKDIDTTREELFKLNFIEDKDFSNFMTRHYAPPSAKNKIF